MLTEPVIIPDARIVGLSYALKGGFVSSRLTVTSGLLPALATALGCSELLFLEDGTPKSGFARLDLDTCCEQYCAVFECAAAELKQEFTIEGDVCDGFCVDRTENNEFRLRFRLHHRENLHGPLAFVEQIGTGSSLVRLTPKQALLFAAAEKNTKGANRNEPDSA
jgi:hypothetical protein